MLFIDWDMLFIINIVMDLMEIFGCSHNAIFLLFGEKKKHLQNSLFVLP